MWNPFKKKNEGFKLNEEELPSLSDINSEDLKKDENKGLNSLSNGVPNLESSSESKLEGGSFNDNSFSLDKNDVALTQSFTQQGNQNSSFSSFQNDFNSDLSKAKFETIEAKITLIEARLSTIEQKLEILFRLVYEEVSDETKRKLKLDSILNK